MYSDSTFKLFLIAIYLFSFVHNFSNSFKHICRGKNRLSLNCIKVLHRVIFYFLVSVSYDPVYVMQVAICFTLNPFLDE